MNGTMKYTRRVNLGNYEHKEFTAEISYSVDEEADYLDSKTKIDRAADLAVEIAEGRLGLRPTTRSPQEIAKAIAERAAYNADPEARHGIMVPTMLKQGHKHGAPIVAVPVVEGGRVTSINQAGADLLLDAISVKSAPKESTLASREQADQLAWDEHEKPRADEAEAPLPAEEVSYEDIAAHVIGNEEPLLGDEHLTTFTHAEVWGPEETFDAEAPLPAEEISYDDMLKVVNGWVSAGEPKVRQNRVVQFQKLLRGYAKQLSYIPVERRAAFMAQIAELQASIP